MADPVTSPSACPLFKVVNDPIHGHINLHPLIVKIIDTPQFQRLRYICQLGGVYYVFPGATHNRFEHSIGTSHLAGELVQTLFNRQPELNITQEDILCVQIAGLCHDLGHGPFSHLFDQRFMTLFPKENNKIWKHEDGSLMMFDYMIEENNLKDKFNEYNLTDKDITFIKGLIYPKKAQRNETETGRGEDKNFLYEIVANKRNGIDVDKWDYFARDAYSVGIANNFDHRRLMKFARVLGDKSEKQICFRDKECSNIYDMFHTRFLLHRRVYQHKTNRAVEFMIRDALLAANDHILLNGKNGKTCKLSEAVYKMDVYLKLTDHIYHQILCSVDDNLSKAREIIERIERRDLYRLIGTVKLGKGGDEEKVLDEIVASYADLKKKDDELTKFSKCDLEIQFVNLDYGMKEKNPIEEVSFYQKKKPNEAVKLDQEEVMHIMPSQFIESSIRIFSKRTDQETFDTIEECFDAWCAKGGHKKVIS